MAAVSPAENEALKKEIEEIRSDIESASKSLRRSEEKRLCGLLFSSVAFQVTQLEDMLGRIRDEKDMSASERERVLQRMCVIGAYVKRRCNLMLLEETGEDISGGELQLCFREIVMYLKRAGASAAEVIDIKGSIPADLAYAALDLYELIVEHELDRMSSMMITMKRSPDSYRFMLRMDIDGPPSLIYLDRFEDEVLPELETLHSHADLHSFSRGGEVTVTLEYTYE